MMATGVASPSAQGQEITSTEMATVQREFQAVSRDHPDDERHRRNAHDHRDEHARDLIRQPGDGRFGAARVLHHADDLRQSGVLAHLVRPEFQVARRY